MHLECRQRNGGHFSKGDELKYATEIITYEYGSGHETVAVLLPGFAISW